MRETRAPRTPDFAGVVAAAERVRWRLDDVLPPGSRFDFTRLFMPEALAGTLALEAELDAPALATLNHIRAHGYLGLFGLVEEAIVPFVVSHLKERLEAPLPEQRALLGFAEEETKHIALFRRFHQTFVEGFAAEHGGAELEVIGPASAVRAHVLGHHPIGVGLFILHIEWMTQRHYVESVRNGGPIEPLFARLLHQHWLEESQHARMDGWIVEAAAAEAGDAERDKGVDDYLALVAYLDEALAQQAELDVGGLERALGRRVDRDLVLEEQHRSMREAFLVVGLTHPRVLDVLDAVHPEGRSRALKTARALGHPPARA